MGSATPFILAGWRKIETFTCWPISLSCLFIDHHMITTYHTRIQNLRIASILRPILSMERGHPRPYRISLSLIAFRIGNGPSSDGVGNVTPPSISHISLLASSVTYRSFISGMQRWMDADVMASPSDVWFGRLYPFPSPSCSLLPKQIDPGACEHRQCPEHALMLIRVKVDCRDKSGLDGEILTLDAFNVSPGYSCQYLVANGIYVPL
jgi:hypothetical protein